MSDVLDQVLLLVVEATHALVDVEDDDLDVLLLGRRCLDVQSLLLDAGAVDVDDPTGLVDPVECLERATALLDALPAEKRPPGLASARAELRAVLAAVRR